MTSPCRSCKTPVEWVVVEASGKRMPIDPDPHPLGTVARLGYTDEETGADVVEVLKLGGGGLDESRPLYLSHFATCPNAAQHRKKK